MLQPSQHLRFMLEAAKHLDRRGGAADHLQATVAFRSMLLGDMHHSHTA